MSWGERIAIALDIAKGMEFLHFMNPPVIHRDLKSLNVFMTKINNNWAAKVADFGLSRSPDADMMTSALGTLVILYLFSIGWLHNYSVINNIL